MDPDKEQLEGSESRDRFKRLHKSECYNSFYSLDIDFAFIEKNEGNGRHGGDLPFIVSIMDFKLPTDSLSFSEVLAYNQFLEHGIPVYIVEAQSEDFVELDTSQHRFDVHKYRGGDYKPYPTPESETELVLENASWDEFESWESELRVERRRQERAYKEAIWQLEDEVENTEDVETLRLFFKLFQFIDSNPELNDALELPDETL